MIVLDASPTIARYHHNEVTLPVLQLFDRIEQQGAIAPPFWKIEIANVLQKKVRDGLYDATYRDEILQDIETLPIAIDEGATGQIWTVTVNLADKHGLTVYDAIYLECAIRNQLPLATLDLQLRAAAVAEGVPLLGL